MPTIIQPTQAEYVSDPFTTSSRGFWLLGSNFFADEYACILFVGPSGNYEEATNDKGILAVSRNPNIVFVDLPPGTYRCRKTKTISAASVGIQEVV